MKPRNAFLMGYGVGVGTLLVLPWLHAGALRVASLLLRRVETSLARAEAQRELPGPPEAQLGAVREGLREGELPTPDAPGVSPFVHS